jgi:hypothetical protein
MRVARSARIVRIVGIVGIARSLRAWTVLGCVLGAGCLGPRPDPSAFFLLSATAVPGGGAPVPGVVGLGPITMPGYLDRPQIVVRLGENEVALAETDRWAEPLRDNLARTLEENLSSLLPEATIVHHPWYEAPDVAVGLDLRRFEAVATGAVVLDATWWITRDGDLVERRATTIEEAAAADGRAASVAAQSRALAELSREVAAGVRRATGG